MPSVVFHRVRVFDGRRSRPACSVAVTDGVITSADSVSTDPGPADAEVVDGFGRMTLLPGLIDAHFHLLGEASLRQALTFGTTTRGGVCLRFREPVAGIDPWGRIRHPGLTLTVAEPELVTEVVNRIVAGS